MYSLRGIQDNGTRIDEEFETLAELNARWAEYADATIFQARAYSGDEPLREVAGEWR